MNRPLPPSALDLNRKDWLDWVKKNRMPAFNARQILSWLYQQRNLDPSTWTNLSLATRTLLRQSFSFRQPEAEWFSDKESATRKVLLTLGDGERIEAVWLPHNDHTTFCISSQVGCALACRFCATGTLSLKRNLSVGEILAQILVLLQQLPPEQPRYNLVFMGMGEPLLNREALFAALELITHPEGLGLSPRHITISSAGIIDGLAELEERFPKIRLSLSLNAPNEALRRELMPITRSQPLDELLDSLRQRKRDYPLTLEYVLLPGINDLPEHAGQVHHLLRGLEHKINVIPFNPSPGLPYRAPTEEEIDAWATRLHQFGETVMVRRSQGRRIASACGQLVTRT